MLTHPIHDESGEPENMFRLERRDSGSSDS